MLKNILTNIVNNVLAHIDHDSGTNRGKNDTQNNETITLQDGSVWTITEVNSNDLTQGYTVTIDMNSGGDNCWYNASSCKKPDWFRFKVDQYGDVEAGDALTEGSINPHDILKIKTPRAVQDYIISEVQRV